MCLSLRCRRRPKHSTLAIAIVILLRINIKELEAPIITPLPVLLSLPLSFLLRFLLRFLLCRHLFLLSNDSNETSPLPSNAILQSNPHPFPLHQLTEHPLSLPLLPPNTRG